MLSLAFKYSQTLNTLSELGKVARLEIIYCDLGNNGLWFGRKEKG